MSMISSIIINEAILVTLLITMCIYLTATDFKHGIIQNKVLLVTGAIGLVANIVYYSFWGKQFIMAFLLNLVVMMAISIAFYALHIWAAGDSKLLMLTIFLIPATKLSAAFPQVLLYKPVTVESCPSTTLR